METQRAISTERPEFLADSAEQIEESMKRLGPLRNQLYEVCRKAIVRVNKGQQESDQPAINDDDVK